MSDYESYTLNEVACDWLTVGTWDKEQGEMMSETIEGMGGEEKRIMQYEGVGEGGVFAGEGVQNGFAHWIFQVSGRAAQFWLDEFFMGDWGLDYSKWSASRYDVQLTLEMPHGYQLTGWEWVARNAGHRTVDHIPNPSQGDTVYLGSKKSRKMVRIYVKGWIRDDGDDQGQQHIRVEFQTRREASQALFSSGSIKSDYVGMWDGVNGRVPRVAGYDACMCPVVRRVFDDALPNLGTQLEYMKLVAPDTLKWIKDAVHPAITKQINFHDDYAAKVIRNYCETWLGMIDRKYTKLDL